MSQDFVPVVRLYKRRSREGTLFYYGRLRSTNTGIYLFAVRNRSPKDAEAEFVLCLRQEDAARLKGLLTP